MWGGITYHQAAVAVSEQPRAGFISAEKTAFSEWVLCADGHAVPSCTQRFFGVPAWGWYHYPRRALRAVETPDGRLSKRLTCRFLRSGEQRSLRSAYFLRIYRIFCRQFQLQTLLRYGTINPRNWKNFRTIMPLNSRLQLQVPHRGHAPNNRKEVLSHEETHLLGSGSPPAAEPCRLRGWSRPQFLRVLRRCLLFRRVFSDGRP